MPHTPSFHRFQRLLGGSLLLAGLGMAPAMAADSITPELRSALADRVLFNAGRAGETFDSYIVHYRNDAPAGEEKSTEALQVRKQLDADLARTSKALGYKALHERRLATGGHLIRLEGGKRLAADASDVFMAELAANPDISSIEPNARQHIRLIPNDPLFSRIQWALTNPQSGINVTSAWDQSTGTDVVIAIVDTGSTQHPDLDGNTVAGYDFISDAEIARDGNGRDADPSDEGDWFEEGDCPSNPDESRDSSWHGTHVAGIAAAMGNNGIGIAGVAFNAKIQHVRALGRCGGSLADIAESIIWASGGRVSGVPNNATPAKVINLSLGGEGACGTTYRNAVNQARSRGAVLIAAAGNDDEDMANSRPANCQGVLSVAATSRSGTRASYSNYGSGVDIAAPGGDCDGPCQDDPSGMIASTFNDGTTTPGSEPVYVYMLGTSMATPFVSGVAALMLSKNPSLTPEQTENLLKNTARPFPSMCADGCGSGIVDATAAVAAASGSSISQYPISVSRSGNGSGTITSSPSGIQCGTLCSSRFNANATVRLTATPTAGSRFTGWSGACSGTATTCTVKADQAHAAIAQFNVPVTRLRNPAVATDLSGITGSIKMYAISIPSGTGLAEFKTRGGSGNVDLYVRYGTPPTLEHHDCGPKRPSNNETCSFRAPMAGTYYIMLTTNSSYTDVRLEARHSIGPIGGKTLTNNVPIGEVFAPKNGARYFKINVPASASRLRIQTTGNNGDLDMYVGRGGEGGSRVPTLEKFDWVSGRWDSNESLQIDAPVPAMYYIMLHAYEAFENVSIIATYTNATIQKTGSGNGRVQVKRASGSETLPVCTSFPCELALRSISYDLIAVPASGSRFAGWDASQCNRIVNGNCRIRVTTQHRYITANFTSANGS